MSSYYYKSKGFRRTLAELDADLRDEIERIHVQFPGYGYRRIREHLFKTQGRRVNHKRIRRIMGVYGLKSVLSRVFLRTTQSDHDQKIYPNLIKKRQVTGLDQVWSADLTYIRIKTGFVYLAAILDVYSRKIIGWAISRHIRQTLCLSALEMALRSRRPPYGTCIHHSDRGMQYASSAYTEKLKFAGMAISMSAKKSPYDNAMIESFFKTLKYEEVNLSKYETFKDVIQGLPYFIEEVYNEKRLHSGIDYQSPNEFEQALRKNQNSDRYPILQLW